MAGGPWDSVRGVHTGRTPGGREEGWVEEHTGFGARPILGISVGPLGRVSFSSENPPVSPGLLPLGLAWGEPGMGGAGLHGLGGDTLRPLHPGALFMGELEPGTTR